MPRGSVSPTPPRRLLRTWRVIVQDVMVTDLDGVTWQYPREGMLWAGSAAGRKTQGDAVGNQPCECTACKRLMQRLARAWYATAFTAA